MLEPEDTKLYAKLAHMHKYLCPGEELPPMVDEKWKNYQDIVEAKNQRKEAQKHLWDLPSTDLDDTDDDIPDLPPSPSACPPPAPPPAPCLVSPPAPMPRLRSGNTPPSTSPTLLRRSAPARPARTRRAPSLFSPSPSPSPTSSPGASQTPPARPARRRPARKSRHTVKKSVARKTPVRKAPVALRSLSPPSSPSSLATPIVLVDPIDLTRDSPPGTLPRSLLPFVNLGDTPPMSGGVTSPESAPLDLACSQPGADTDANANANVGDGDGANDINGVSEDARFGIEGEGEGEGEVGMEMEEADLDFEPMDGLGEGFGPMDGVMDGLGEERLVPMGGFGSWDAAPAAGERPAPEVKPEREEEPKAQPQPQPQPQPQQGVHPARSPATTHCLPALQALSNPRPGPRSTPAAVRRDMNAGTGTGTEAALPWTSRRPQTSTLRPLPRPRPPPRLARSPETYSQRPWRPDSEQRGGDVDWGSTHTQQRSWRGTSQASRDAWGLGHTACTAAAAQPSNGASPGIPATASLALSALTCACACASAVPALARGATPAGPALDPAESACGGTLAPVRPVGPAFGETAPLAHSTAECVHADVPALARRVDPPVPIPHSTARGVHADVPAPFARAAAPGTSTPSLTAESRGPAPHVAPPALEPSTSGRREGLGGAPACAWTRPPPGAPEPAAPHGNVSPAVGLSPSDHQVASKSVAVPSDFDATSTSPSADSLDTPSEAIPGHSAASPAPASPTPTLSPGRKRVTPRKRTPESTTPLATPRRRREPVRPPPTTRSSRLRTRSQTASLRLRGLRNTSSPRASQHGGPVRP